ncbi:MacB-like periplasmic core domain protein [uncultured archaeon]|nr:MacB-like periplasmic core domain protein [uncultured archaeon]
MIGKESVAYSLRNLRNRKTRSFFTVFSIMLGITTIFIFVSFGVGLYKYIETVSSASSFDKVVIQPKGTGIGGLDTTFSFSEGDLTSIKRASGVYDATGLYFKIVEVKQSTKIAYAYLIAYDPKVPLMMDVFSLDMLKGRNLKPGDRGIILGSNYQIKDKIFPKAYDVNQEIEVNSNKFKVLGFYEPIGDPIDDAQVYVTNDIMKEMFNGTSYNWIIAKVDVSNIDRVIKNIEDNLRKERNLEKGKEDFYVQSFEDMIKTYTSILDIVIGFIILIALISILVSSLNTANTMITSVLERTKEIGIIKSIGGTNAEIFSIFLFESAFLGFIAGCLGVLFGGIITFIGGEILKNLGYGFVSPYFSVELFLGCILFAVVTGAISGVIPAVKASRTNTIETIRYE